MAVPASNGKTVLITGINGYIASVLGAHLLAKGYSIRGTSRKAASAEPLLKGPYAPYADRVKLYEVPDMTVEGAFDEAVKGVDGIFHTASPINFSPETTYANMVVPAVKGSETILFSALKAGSQLTSVVVTSSVAAVVSAKDDPEYTFTEKDFATTSLDKANEDRAAGIATPAGILYGASKTAADRAVWQFRKEHKPAFAITTINPSVVIGPPVLLAASGDKLNETLKPFYDVFSGTTKTIGPNIGTGSFVDVRDVAYMHIWAYEHASQADGQRYIACQGFGPLQAVADILRLQYDGTSIGDNIPAGVPGDGYLGYKDGRVEFVAFPPGKPRVDGSFGAKTMGLKYKTFPESVVDTAKAFEALL